MTDRDQRRRERERLEKAWTDAFNRLRLTPEWAACQTAMNAYRDHDALYGDLSGPEPVGIFNTRGSQPK
jgi:hypothetical protein